MVSSLYVQAINGVSKGCTHYVEYVTAINGGCSRAHCVVAGPPLLSGAMMFVS